jgi:hypothetical protein
VKLKLARILTLVFIICLSPSSLQGMQQPKDLSSSIATWKENIKMIGDHFYVGKIKGRDLWVVMERVTDDNRNLWWKYINVQLNPQATRAGREYESDDGKRIMPNFSNFGSSPFRYNLENVDRSKSELWVVYITTNSNPEPITTAENRKRIESYSLDYLPESKSLKANPTALVHYDGKNYDPHKFPGNILMFVTAITSPEALITSHMGVSISIEGIYQRKFGIGEAISIDLHSGAAKFHLIRNRGRKYMINQPTQPMEKQIFINMPPHTCFAGTREMKKLSDEYKHMTLAEFERDHVQVWERAKQLDKEKSIEAIFQEHQEDMVESQGFSGWDGTKTLVQLWEKYPPILSVDDQKGKQVFERFTVFANPHTNDIWLKVQKKDDTLHVYDFMFNCVTKFGLVDHLIAVDLYALARAKELDKYQQK